MSVSALCEALAKNEAYVEVFTTTANGKEELPLKPGLVHEIDGVKVSYFKRLTKDHTHFSPALLKSLRAKVKEFDAVHIHAWWNLVSVLAALIGIFKGTPVIVSPRGMLSSYSFGNKNDFKKKLIHNTLGKRLLQQCHVHATAQSEALAINEIIKPLSITVIPNFVTIPISVPVRAAKEQSSPIKLLFFSRIEEKKGLDILLQALPHLNFTFSLTIAGTGEPDYIEYLKTLVKNDTIAGRVNWLGFIGVDKFELLSGHHLMVLPSHDENFGNVVIESLSVGTPVLVSDKVGLATYVTDKQLGWAYKGEELAETLNAVSADFDLKYERITNTAPQTIREDFDEKMLVEKYLDLYNCIK